MQNNQVTQMSTEGINPRENRQKEHPKVSEIQAYLVSYLAKLLEIEPNKVDIKMPFDRYSMDSSASIGMITHLEDWLGYELDPTTLYYYPTIDALARHLGLAKDESDKDTQLDS